MSDSPFKMPGSQLLGRGNQSVSPGKYTASPTKQTDKEKQTNLLNAVPNEKAYNLLSDADKKNFDATGARVGLPTKPAKSATPYASPLLDGQHPHSKARQEFETMKKGSGNSADKLTTTYGGTWSKKGNRTAYTNESGQTAKQVAQAKSRSELKNKK